MGAQVGLRTSARIDLLLLLIVSAMLGASLASYRNLLAAVLLVGYGRFVDANARAKRKNVLFIVNDDLRPMISDLHPEKFGYMHTPNFNAFMRESLVLTNSHVQEAVCSPSRTSVLFGRRPDTTKVWNLYDNAREVGCANCMTIPGLFKEAGYYTIGMGKIFHDGHASNNQDPQSWSDPAYAGENFFLGEDTYNNGTASWTSVNEKATGQCQDSEVRDHAVTWLRNLTARRIKSALVPRCWISKASSVFRRTTGFF